AGLRVLGNFAGVPQNTLAARPSWASAFERIESALKARAADPASQSDRGFIREASAWLYAVKNAWRNEVMHLESNYGEERAGEIFSATKALMRHLATRLEE